MKATRLITLIALAASVASQAGAQAASKSPAKPKPQSLSAQAKIQLDSATKLALARVPGGTVKKYELEKEDGHFIYSFDIAVPGKPGIQEVWVSAIDGHIVRVEHETAAMQKAEEAKEKAEAAKRKAAPTPAKKKP